MSFEKVLYILGTIFLIIFIVSAILVLTNTLNMWLVGIISLLVSIICFVILKVVKKSVK